MVTLCILRVCLEWRIFKGKANEWILLESFLILLFGIKKKSAFHSGGKTNHASQNTWKKASKETQRKFSCNVFSRSEAWNIASWAHATFLFSRNPNTPKVSIPVFWYPIVFYFSLYVIPVLFFILLFYIIAFETNPKWKWKIQDHDSIAAISFPFRSW